jgi:hypothetical protein
MITGYAVKGQAQAIPLTSFSGIKKNLKTIPKIVAIALKGVGNV